MRFLMRVRFPTEEVNDIMRDPKGLERFQAMVGELKPEAVYFTLVEGSRGAHIILNMNDASQMPAIAEPFFLMTSAEIDITPVMVPEDLNKAGPAIAEVVKKWG